MKVTGETSSRKREHVDLVVNENVVSRQKTTGFENWEFEHNALPELDFDAIDCATGFLGERISFPLLITGMTGGYEGAYRINAQLAEVCHECSLAIGTGSQRQAIEDERFHHTYRVLREKAPKAPIVANIGAAEVARFTDTSIPRRIVDMLEANALAVHLNPLQEFLQPEGDTRFRGVLAGIERIVHDLSVPVMIKEVGAGISARVARQLFEVGVLWIDVSGAGGTSWAGVEMTRRSASFPISDSFWDWGIPTASAIRQVSAVTPSDRFVLASGGISDGVIIAKALALGAHMAGAARPLLKTLIDRGQASLMQTLKGWENDLRGVMFLTGAPTIDALRKVTLVHCGTL